MALCASWRLFVGYGSAIAACFTLSCSDRSVPPEDVGEAEVALTNAPADVKCLKLTVNGPQRTDVRKFPLTAGQRAVFHLNGLPVGRDTFTANAYNAACEKLNAGVDSTWYSEPVVADLRAGRVTRVSLKMIHNGKASVGVDFDDKNGPPGQGEPDLEGGVESSEPPYIESLGCPVDQDAVLTVGDSPNMKPDGSPYRLVGSPDGMGAFENVDGTFTLLVNHELAATAGIVRAHGARGAFVSRWIVRKADLAVMEGSDLIQQVALWNPMTSSYDAPTKGVAFGRLASADLPNPSALYDAATGLGFDGRLFFNGEQVGDEGRAFAHGMDGTSWEFARMGNANWENVVPNPGSGERTVVIGTDDSGGGQLYVYVGEKTDSGSPIDRAGLTNGTLYGVVVSGTPAEPAAGIPDAGFALHSFGNVENQGGAELQRASVAALVTGFARPEDGAWDPNSPNDFYFVTTAAFELPSRLWRLRFADAANPAQGGRIQMLLDGTEGQRMLDNITVDQYGHVYLQEDPGNNAHLAKIWRYDIASDQLSEVARHSPALFTPNGGAFRTQDEESSGIIDLSDIMGPSTFLVTTKVSQPIQGELVEGGQISFFHDNDGLGGVMAAIATLMVECTGKIGPESFVLTDIGLNLPDNFECTTGLERDFDKEGSLRAFLSLQRLRPDGSPRPISPNARQCIGDRWAAWRQTFARTGITQDQCPAWKRTGITEDSDERLKAQLDVLSEAVPTNRGTFVVRNPPDLEGFKVFREFEVGFDLAEPMHACLREGPGACAALCAGAFPGFVIEAKGTNVRVDAMEWLEDRIRLDPRTNRYLREGYYHPTWAYSYGPTLGHRARANSCNAMQALNPQCPYEVMPQAFVTNPTVATAALGETRSCSLENTVDTAVTNDNCASEMCTVWVQQNEFQFVRFRLDCLGTLDFDRPGNEAAYDAIWNTCNAHCYLPP